MRRLMQEQGAEIIHLGHNRGAEEIVRAALQEDADGIAVSSYQGGHVEFFKYVIDLLRQAGAGHVRVFGGGGGVIVPTEIRELEAYGVERIYSPDDGRDLGLPGMITDMMTRTRAAVVERDLQGAACPADQRAVATTITLLETHADDASWLESTRAQWPEPLRKPPVIGITGPGGAGKSSLTDELIARFLHQFPDLQIAVLAVDPTRRRTGGALLGDRIRMNSLDSPRVFMRSMATRRSHLATNAILKDAVRFLSGAGYGLVIVETAGIGQSDSEIVDLADLSLYVMTSEYGAATQLEKIDMLDFADVIALNKFEKRGAEDALRDVRKQWRRNRNAFEIADEEIPVYPTIASQFNDGGVNWLFVNLCRKLVEKCVLPAEHWTADADASCREPKPDVLIPAERVRYLAEIAAQGRAVRAGVEARARAISEAWHFHHALSALQDPALPVWLDRYPAAALDDDSQERGLLTLRQRYQSRLDDLDDESLTLLRGWPATRDAVTAPQYSYQVRGREIAGANYVETLSHLQVPKVAPPRFSDPGDLLRFLSNENLPGRYPYTGGVYPYRRSGEDPTRMFAGEGTPERTNRRFHYVSIGQPAIRLSTAFDSVTLYGEDPHERPDIYGKVGNSGVSICTLDDMKKLYSGFDLCDPKTSVSLTINGPAP
ncbi:MAG: methylmalonyl-CoA mutase family protein, partial [Pseudomonadota bacterium]|nr:methylmalonyl-CoA mutase family protein [Pseudomonadota bacterium]